MRIWFRCFWRGWCGIDEVLLVVLCHGADASDMTARQQASLEATTIKTVSDVIKRHEKVIRIEGRVVVVTVSCCGRC